MRLLLLALLACLAAPAALASPQGREGYESRLVERAVAASGRPVDPAPEGKTIREILVRPHDIIGPDDPYPRVLNAVHVTTREAVVRRELLFEVGQRWRAEAILETERNLRALAILAMAKVVPLSTGEPGTVDALVVTRDLWSIRFNSSYNLVGSLLQYLRVQPTEQNLAGRDKRLSLDFELRLDTVAFGQAYADRRLFGTRLALTELARVVFNRATFQAEGSEGFLRLERPLFSLDTEWGFDAAASWRVRRDRLYRGPAVWELPVPSGGTVPHTYDSRQLGFTAFYTRSHQGPGFKLDLAPGAGGYDREFVPPPGLAPAQVEVLRAVVLPRSERALYAALRFRAYTPEYRSFRNLETFALTEDYQVGPRILGELRFANPAGDTFAEGWLSVRYRLPVGDSLTTLSAAGSVRFVPGAATEEGTWVNRAVAADLTHVSPFVGPGRFAARAMVEVRAQDLDRTTLLLGGGNGLRGTTPEVLSGTRRVLFNLEYRTRAIELYTVHLGGVLFWDAGAAWEGPGLPRLVHTAGIGARLLFPQFDVEPGRGDFGWVLGGESPPPLERFSSSFGQVTRYRPKMLDQPFE